MIAEERIITAIDVQSGEYVDGTECNKLLTRTEEAGVKVEALSGDRAYFKKSILDEPEQRKIESIIPVSACVYKVDEDLLSYNKDSDEWFCGTGNKTVRKTQKCYSSANPIPGVVKGPQPLKELPHNTAAHLAVPFPTSAACRFLDLPPAR